jgi:AcrR family transcriptional regulator
MMVATAERRRMKAEERREQILDVTHAVVAAEGFHAATPNRIAQAAGITRPVLYQQFGDLGSLFVALINREAKRAATQFMGVIAKVGIPGPGDGIVDVFRELLKALDESPSTWRLFLFPPEGAPPALYERLARSEEQVRLFLQLALARTYPELRDPEYSAYVVHGAGRELLRLRLTDPAHATHERLVTLVTDMVAGADHYRSRAT